MSSNVLLRDRDVDFLLYELVDAPKLAELPAFADHGRETFDLYLASVRRFAREVLFPSYKAMDEAPPALAGGHVALHPRMKAIWPELVALGVVTATRPVEVGGQRLPATVAALAHAYLMAGNLSAYGFAGLTTGAAHLIEAFGDAALKEELMTRLYAGEWTGTMALTEPHAGSSLADITTRATPRPDGTFAISGAKIFISGGEHDLVPNVVNMVLARIDGAPAGTKGVSLFAVPNKRLEGDRLVPNDVHVAGVIHKIGWRGLPSLALSFGDDGDCRGRLVGEPNKGLGYMFQMMNEARLMVGVNGVATASVAYHESLLYAQERKQGRRLGEKDPARPQVPIVEHADVRRMLLRQKAIVEGGLALIAFTALQADLAEHATDPSVKRRAAVLLDALTPIAKSFPAEWGFESNALAVQIHGGYGYSSEQLPEAWLRDQKLNTIHEGTTGIQGLDLLGRRIVAGGGEPLRILGEEIETAIARALAAGIDPAFVARLSRAGRTLVDVTEKLAGLGLAGDAEAMLRHATDYLALASIVVVALLWVRMASIAKERLASATGPDADFYEGKLAAGEYWLATEVPRVDVLAELCRSNEASYARVKVAWL